MAVPDPELPLRQGADVENAVGNDAVTGEIGTSHDLLLERRLLLSRQQGRGPPGMPIDQTRQPIRVVAIDPDPQHIARHPELLGRHAAPAALEQSRDRQDPRPHLAPRLLASGSAQRLRRQPFRNRQCNHRPPPINILRANHTLPTKSMMPQTSTTQSTLTPVLVASQRPSPWPTLSGRRFERWHCIPY